MSASTSTENSSLTRLISEVGTTGLHIFPSCHCWLHLGLQIKDIKAGLQLVTVKITSGYRHNHITSSATLRSSDWKTARFLVISSNPFLSREWLLSSTRTLPYHCYLTILPCGSQGALHVLAEPLANEATCKSLAQQTGREQLSGVTEARGRAVIQPFRHVFGLPGRESLISCDQVQRDGASDTGFVSTSSLLREERSVGAIEPVVW